MTSVGKLRIRRGKEVRGESPEPFAGRGSRKRSTTWPMIVVFLASLAAAQNPYVTVTGAVQGPNGLPATNQVISFTPTQQFFVAGTGSTSCSNYNIDINSGALSCGDTINFNNTTPAAPTNGLNIQWQTSKSGTTDSVSAAIVGDGVATDCLIGTGIFTACPGGGGGGGVSGSGTTGFLAEWTNSTTLGNSPLRDSTSASWPGGGITSATHTLNVFPENGFGTTCFNAAPFCISQGWRTADILGSLTPPFAGEVIINGLNGAALSGLGSFPSLVGIHIYNGQTTGSVTGTLPAQAGIVITPISGAEAVTNDYGMYFQAMNTGSGTVTNHYGLYMEDQTTTDNAGTPPTNPHAITVAAGGIQHLPTLFSKTPSCNSTYEGTMWAVSDSTTNTWGAPISGSGGDHVMAYCDGTNWTVMGK